MTVTEAGTSGSSPFLTVTGLGGGSLDVVRDKRAGLAMSCGLHTLIIGMFLFFGYSEPDIEAPVIAPERLMTARLVARGKPRPKKLLPRIMGRKPSKKKAVHLGAVDKKAEKKVEKKKVKEEEEVETEQDLDASKILANLMKTRVDKRADKQPEKWGREDGDALGTASSGRTERIYEDKLIRKLNGTVRYSGIDQSELLKLSASIRLEIDKSGKIASYAFKRRSGNPRFDAAVERAVRIFSTEGPRALDPPPEDIFSGDVYRVTATFKPHKK